MEELFSVVDGVSIRRMFGGLGIFREGLMFALVADDVLYMKADEQTAPAYEAEGCGQWTYEAKTRVMPMPYWRLPERLHDEPEEFRTWALAAFDVAKRTAKPKTAKAVRAKPGKKAAANGATAKPRAVKRAAKRKK
jgi:DNA transformation protein